MLKNSATSATGGWQQGRIQRGAIAAYVYNFLTMILHNSENSIRDLTPFCRPLCCYSNVVEYTSSLLQ